MSTNGCFQPLKTTKRMKPIFYSLCLLSLFSVFSCKKEKKKDHHSEKTAQVDTFSYHWATDSASWGKTTAAYNQKSRPLASVRYQYPVLDGPARSSKVIGRINRCILRCPKLISSDSIPKVPAAFFSEYQKLKDEIPDYQTPWSYTIKAAVLENSPKVFSVAVKEISYMGGAHDQVSQHLQSFVPATGDTLTLQTLFGPKLASAEAIASSYFRKKYRLNDGQSVNSQGFWFENDKFSLPNNFAIINDSIRFLYNPYEIAPFAMGSITIKLPLDTLRNCISIKTLKK